MRSPLGTAAALLLSGGLVLSGCSLLPGGDDPKSADKTAPTERKVVSLPSTAWVAAAGDRVAKGGTLRLAAAAVPRSFNPLHADAAMSDAADILAPTAGGAVRLTGGGSWKVDPDYAESVKIADTNPLTIAVKLNRRAVWQGGTSITGKDMVAFWKVQNGTDSDFDVSSTAGYEDIRDVRVGKDPFSYSVVFKKPIGDWPLFIYPHLPSNVSSSPELFNKAFRKRAIPSNGPFIVSSIDTVRGAIVEKPNPRWWGTPPKLDGITWRVAPPATQAKAYVARELDAVKLQPETYDTAKASGTVQRAAGLEWTQITLNGARGPLRSVSVRRAVAPAVNRRVVAAQSADAVGAPTETLGSFTYLPGQRGYHDSSASIAYDPAKSARLLADDGWVKGSDGVLTRKGKKLVLTMPVPDKTPTNT
ncbi:ABC transporter substrate-binding protein, partial [Aeromicrobium sp.]|uniref:ABC transporter substrate-binding protein n=1 Tax=Aeromicrobium sp. TaxID=1871063 RepID=UPI0019BE66A6